MRGPNVRQRRAFHLKLESMRDVRDLSEILIGVASDLSVHDFSLVLRALQQPEPTLVLDGVCALAV